MAEYIKFRLTAAKVSVSMAFLALLGGLAARAGAQPTRGGPHAAAARKDKWLPALLVSGLSSQLQSDLAKIETTLGSVYDKDQKAIASSVDKSSAGLLKFEKSVAATYYDKSTIDDTFVKIDDAAAKFLSIGGTAVNSSKLGGLTPNQFIQGTGSVATNAVTISLSGNSAAPQTLLTVPGTNGEIIVVCMPLPGGGVGIQFTNGTNGAIPAIKTLDGFTDQTSLPSGSSGLTIPIDGPTQLTLQTFPTAAFNQVLTFTISGETVGNNIQVVGQVLNGDG